MSYGPNLAVSDVIVGFNDEITDAKFRKVKKQGALPYEIEKEHIIVATNSSILK